MGKFPFHIDCGTSSVESDICWFPFYGGPNLEKIPKKPTTPPKKKHLQPQKLLQQPEFFEYSTCAIEGNRQETVFGIEPQVVQSRRKAEPSRSQNSKVVGLDGILVSPTSWEPRFVPVIDRFFSQLNVWRTHRTFMGASDDGMFPGSGDLTLSYFI